MTNVNWTRNLVLAIVLFVGGSFAFWNEYKHRPEKESAEEASKKVFAIQDAGIISMRLENGDKIFQWNCEEASCKPGSNSKWKLSQPIQARADDSSTNSLVSTLNNLAPTDTLDLKDETPEKRATLLKEYGLSPELRTGKTVRRVDVKTSSGEEVVYLGATNPINDNIFAVIEKVPSGQNPSGKIDDKKVYQIPSYFKSNFDHDVTHWRDKKILTFNAADVDSFTLTSKKNGTIRGERKADGWVLKTKSGEFDGDVENVENMLSAASYLSAKSFVADSTKDPKAQAILKKNPEIVSLTLNRKKGAADKQTPAPIVLTLYGSAENKKAAAHKPESAHSHDLEQGASTETPVYATASGNDPLYELMPASRRQFDREVKELRMSKLMTSLERFSVRTIGFSGKPMGEKPLTLSSKDSKWIGTADQKEVNADLVQKMLDQLSGKHIQNIFAASSAPSGEEGGLTVVLGDDKDPKKHQFLFWKNGGVFYARDLASARKEVFQVDSSVGDSLPWDRSFLTKK